MGNDDFRKSDACLLTPLFVQGAQMVTLRRTCEKAKGNGGDSPELRLDIPLEREHLIPPPVLQTQIYSQTQTQMLVTNIQNVCLIVKYLFLFQIE